MGGAEMEGPAMAESAERLRGELSDKLELIRRAGGGCCLIGQMRVARMRSRKRAV
jgi:hypothetical protein